jgi:hypothetical protein
MVRKQNKVEAEKQVEPVTDAVTSVSVYSSRNVLVRSYSLELHGKDFEKLAAEYAGKIKGSVR